MLNEERDSFFDKKKMLDIFYFSILPIILFLIPSIVLLILSIIGIINNTSYQFLIFVFSGLFLFYLITIIMCPTPIFFIKLQKLLDDKNEEEIVKLYIKTSFVRKQYALEAIAYLNPELADKFGVAYFSQKMSHY